MFLLLRSPGFEFLPTHVEGKAPSSTQLGATSPLNQLTADLYKLFQPTDSPQGLKHSLTQ